MNLIQSHRANRTTSTTLRGVLAPKGLALTSFALAAVALTGCGNGVYTKDFGVGAPPSSSAVRFTGNVHGGQQPISGATIQLYAVNTSTLKGAATPLITGGNVGLAGQSVTSTGGGFNITGLYTCPTPSTDVYLVASAGDPTNGASGYNNTAINLVAALGDCNAVTTGNIFINVNEVSTTAAAYALAPFAADLTHVGGTQAQLTAAFSNANELYNLGSGYAGGAALATGTTAPVAQMYTVANILASCVNTSSGASASCTAINGATSATETFGAALGIAKNPGAPAVTALIAYNQPAAAPFQPSMSSVNDFTMAMNYAATAGTLSSPFGIAIDGSGNAWVTNEGGSTIAELSPTNGTVLTVQTATNLFGAEGIAVDTTGNVWVANTAGNSVVKFAVSGGTVTGSSSYTSGGITAPTAIALDSAGNAFVSNLNGNSVTKLTSAGAGTSLTPAGLTVPSGIAIDTTKGASGGNVYVTSGAGTVLELTNAGALTATLTDNALQGPLAVAVDPSGNVFASGSTTNGSAITGGVAEINSGTGLASSISPASSGVSTPFGVATDGTSVWVANSTTSGSLAQLTYGSAVPVSPTAGFGSLNTPVGVAIDNTGSIWTTNSGSNSISKFIGLATPVATPIATNVGP